MEPGHRISGVDARMQLPGGGVVLTDAGTRLEDSDRGGGMVFRSAHHPMVAWGEGDTEAIASSVSFDRA